MENVTESLAGRVGILTLMGLSLRELLIWQLSKKNGSSKVKESANLSPEGFIPTDRRLLNDTQVLPGLNIEDLWKIIQRGSMPELAANSEYDWSMFYG